MTQQDFGTINPADKSGTQLAADLNAWRDTIHSSHRGNTQPPYRVPGMIWVDDGADPVWVIKLFDGAQWIDIATINAADHSNALSALLAAKLNKDASNVGDTTAQAAFRSAIGANLLGGFRNRLINALGTINQRGYVGGAATSGANRYTLDRWRVVTSGQNLSWTESEGVRTMTAPAGGVEQVIEGASILSGNHVLNWEGTATATVNGTARTKGEVFSLTGGTNATVRFSGGTFSKPQLEEGGSPTAFEVRNRQQELALCQRFLWKPDFSFSMTLGPNKLGGSLNRVGTILFPVTMRATPTVSVTVSGFTTSVGDISASPDAVRITSPTQNNAGDGYSVDALTADAEI